MRARVLITAKSENTGADRAAAAGLRNREKWSIAHCRSIGVSWVKNYRHRPARAAGHESNAHAGEAPPNREQDTGVSSLEKGIR